jgi:hypothetical protein
VIEDRDGDGTTFVYSTCGIVVGESTEVSSYDCDDGDPNVDVTWYADRDADGYGSSSEVVCAPRGPIPTGFVLRGGDCDDSDLGRNPGRLDLPENGVDEDCDGADAGLCERGYEFCPCDQDLSDVEMSANCDGFDLAIVERVTCEFSCQFEDFVWLGNLGTQAFEGELSLGSGEQSFTLRGPLAAGTVVGPLSVPFRLLATGEPLLVEASVSGDCNPENNTTLSRAASGIRPLCL